jgi:hypothetical protein
MPVPVDSFFRIFTHDVREILRRFYENRHERITVHSAVNFVDHATLERLLALELLEYDPGEGEYRLDDRLESFFEEMLGTAEVAQADWLGSLLEELRRLIGVCQNLGGRRKSETFLKRIVRLLRNADSRARRHLELIRSAVDFDYRAGSDFEVKLRNLQWHLERARGYGDGIAQFDSLLRDHAFFQIQQDLGLLKLRTRLLRRCRLVSYALITIYQQMEDYLNRIQRDYARARKLIRLRAPLDRHEHLATTNLGEIAVDAIGPLFYEARVRTLLAPSILDERPELLERALARAGVAKRKGAVRPVELRDYPPEELPPVIDWHEVFDAFTQQEADLYSFLRSVRVEGRPLRRAARKAAELNAGRMRPLHRGFRAAAPFSSNAFVDWRGECRVLPAFRKLPTTFSRYRSSPCRNRVAVELGWQMGGMASGTRREIDLVSRLRPGRAGHLLQPNPLLPPRRAVVDPERSRRAFGTRKS